jgi:hypothetical protein
MVFKMNPLPCIPFLQNFKTLKFLYDLVFHQVSSTKHVFVVQKNWNQFYDLCIPFDYFFLNHPLDTWLL